MARQFGKKLIISLIGLVCLIASPAPAQVRLSTLTRTTYSTGLNDSALTLITDSATRTRAATLAQLRFRIFGSASAGTALFTASTGSNVAISLDGSNNPYVGTTTNNAFEFVTNNAVRTALASDGSYFRPFVDSVTALGTSTNRWQTVSAETYNYSVTTVTVSSTSGNAPNFRAGSASVQNITANVTDTVRSPTFPLNVSASQYALVSVIIKNTSGGALTTAPVWNAVYHFGSGGTPTAPATGTQSEFRFRTDGTTLWEVSRTTGITN